MGVVNILTLLGQDKATASLSFMIACTLGPSFGLFLGGPLFDYFGGYRKRRKALRLAFAICCSATTTAPFLMYPKDYHIGSDPAISLCAFAGLCTGVIAMLVPALTGM